MAINSGKNLISNYDSISITELLQKFREQFKQHFLQSEISLQGLNIEFEVTKPSFGGERIWFKCPQCKKRVEKIYSDNNQEVGCRSCLKLEYASRMYKGMVEEALTK